MQYLCLKQLTVGKTTYHLGDTIPDDVILPARSEKLIRSGYISKLDEETEYSKNESGLFTQEQVDKMIAEAVTPIKQKEEELQQVVADLNKCKLTENDGMIPISIKKEADGENGQITIILVTPDEIQQVFSIMQQNADEGSKAITTITSENVLILLHATDSRKTIKEAAKKQADNLFSSNDNINESKKHNEATSMN
ncbi:MAG: hypothetical protein HFJ03_05005 [Lachnospira sp.]|jgi:vacuolar-type H+-ATPase subunit I/STV1|nr:hypothetical protein [Lachnospira sp.]